MIRRALGLCGLMLALCAPATAQTLIENVNGITLDTRGEVVRFSGLVIGKDGKPVCIEEQPMARTMSLGVAAGIGLGAAVVVGLVFLAKKKPENEPATANRRRRRR